MNRINRLSASTLTTILALSTLGLATSSMAMPFGDGSGDCMGGMHRGHPAAKQDIGQGFMLDRMTRRFDLSPEQRKQIESIIEETRPQVDDTRKSMKENRAKLQQLMQQDSYNEADIRKIADKLGDLKSDMIVLRSQQLAKIRAVLTEEQRTQMDEMRERMSTRMSKRMHRMR